MKEKGTKNEYAYRYNPLHKKKQTYNLIGPGGKKIDSASSIKEARKKAKRIMRLNVMKAEKIHIEKRVGTVSKKRRGVR